MAEHQGAWNRLLVAGTWIAPQRHVTGGLRNNDTPPPSRGTIMDAFRIHHYPVSLLDMSRLPVDQSARRWPLSARRYPLAVSADQGRRSWATFRRPLQGRSAIRTGQQLQNIQTTSGLPPATISGIPSTAAPLPDAGCGPDKLVVGGFCSDRQWRLPFIAMTT